MSTTASSISAPWTISLPQVDATDVPPTPRRWTRDEYMRLAEEGFFKNQRVELIDGEIVVMSPQSPEHRMGAARVARLLDRALGDGFFVDRQGPVVQGVSSEPEPDVAVFRGPLDQYDHAHPTTAVLLVEVSKTSMSYDTGKKKNLYALMEVPEYWVLDVVGRRLLVYRHPGKVEGAPFGRDYAHASEVGEGGVVSPLVAPHLSFAIADMLPTLPT